MDKNSLPIGVFDSGVGGLTVASKLRMLLPDEKIIYVGDTKRNPYGICTYDQITQYTLDILRFLDRQPVKMAAIACNTITAASLDAVLGHVDYPLIGMSRGLHTAIDISPKKKIAVFATKVTIESHSHKQMAARMNPDITVVEQACPALANLIERGVLYGEEIMAPLREYVRPVVESGADTAILGCTHYPFIQPLFEKLCGDDIVIIDPAHEMALETLEVLKKNHLLKTDHLPGQMHICFTAQAKRGGKLAQRLLPSHEFTVEEISLT